MSRTIELTRGKVALVDAGDFARLSKHKWCYYACGYAARAETRDGKLVHIYMHREIEGAGPDDVVDHKDGDRLNNSASNLRLCTQGQNLANRASKPGTSSAYKGVWFDRTSGRWAAGVKNRKLGRFHSEQDAARAYDKAAKEVHGEFAYLNFPEEAR